MNLHRIETKSDWHQVDNSDYNFWQRLASTTKGVITPGNILTIAGLVAVIFALERIVVLDYWAGIFLLVTGRLLDVADGLVADISGTKSRLGELLDASIDKIVTFLTIAVFYYISIIPEWLLALILLPHIFIAVIAFVAYLRKKSLHPSLVGKLGMAALWLSLVGFILVKAMGAENASPIAIAVDSLAILSAAMGFYALYEYSFTKETK